MTGIFFSLTLFLFVASIDANAQNDTVNHVDNNGLKQGYWKKDYPNGKLMYEGYFYNGKPVGIMKRFYETGEVRVIMQFNQNSDYVKTKFFYNDGELAAEGTYFQEKKDSTWNYFSFYTGTLTSTEVYNKGVKHGTEKQYYPNGQVSEEIDWVNNAKHGIWNQYFDDGTLKLKTSYSYNQLNGPYTLYWPNGNLLIMGHHLDNKRHGTWTFFTDEGKKEFEIIYKYGKAENEEVIIKQYQEFFKMVEENIGKFEDPTIEDVIPSRGYY
ncbi:MAG: toxin-antitoxin system YwqK family antitoxin [Bacteroidales bacterium]|nr:toxin-antitoxin system YwqK family antitoxin [Bacteroidales bacterium]